MRHFLFYVVLMVLVSLISCKKEIPWTGAPEDSCEWGTEKVYNSSSETVILTIVDRYDGMENGDGHRIEPLVEKILPGNYVSLATPSLAYFPCLHNAKYIEITLGETTVTLQQGTSFFTDCGYEEEVRYVYDDKGHPTSRYKWPVYTYHITKEILGIE